MKQHLVPTIFLLGQWRFYAYDKDICIYLANIFNKPTVSENTTVVIDSKFLPEAD